MSHQAVLRQVTFARAPLSLITRVQYPVAFRFGSLQQAFRSYATLPSVTHASFWESLIPKPLRRHGRNKVKNTKSKEWNPATFFIIILLLIGSMSIQMIALKNEFASFMRRADAKIDLLREVIRRVQNGEDVDVEGLLGTGDAKQEQEWEEILKEIEKEDELWTAARKKKPSQRTPIRENQEPVPVADSKPADAAAKPTPSGTAPRGFY